MDIPYYSVDVDISTCMSNSKRYILTNYKIGAHESNSFRPG